MNDRAQLHTLEGLAAAVLMTLTMLTIVQSTMIVTPQNELSMTVQLEQVSSDALAVLDMAPDTAIEYNLTECIAGWDMKESNVTGNNLDTLDGELSYLLSGTQYNVDLSYFKNGVLSKKQVIINGAPTEDAVVVRRLVALTNSDVVSSGGSWNIANDEVLIVEVKLTAWRI
ncbi:hypothetical protein V7O62_08045 [Methanolobus sp. ZRKC2]|uniref:DUF7288 family protein n=1 Tax=Methanolobus sp. ZRKC2 TaxID=3125783 RepID=UPI00324F9CB1